jgi:hypothetical protein
MAGALTISTLNNDTGVLATQNGMTGIAKAWVNFNGTGTPAINGSFNVSSITDNGTGDYTINFTTAMPNANYSVAGTASANSTGNRPWVIDPLDSLTPTTSAYRFTVCESGVAGGQIDSARICISVFSS